MGLLCPNDSHFLLFGPTRAGKSSFINTLSGKKLVRVGDDRGDSTTTEVSDIKMTVPYSNSEIVVLDVPGMEDTRLALSNKNIRQNIEIKLLNCDKTELSAILVFQSLSTDYLNLRATILQLQQLFDAEVTKSIIVVFTKETRNNTRKQHYETVCGELKVAFVYWRNHYSENEEDVILPQDIVQQQVRELFNKVETVQQYKLARVKQNADEIRRKAQEKLNAYPVQYETKTIQVETQEQELYHEQVTKQKITMTTRKEWDGTTGRWFNQKRTVQVPVVTDYVVEEPRYRPKTVLKDKTIQVARPKPELSYFFDLAKKEKVDELKRLLLN